MGRRESEPCTMLTLVLLAVRNAFKVERASSISRICRSSEMPSLQAPQVSSFPGSHLLVVGMLHSGVSMLEGLRVVYHLDYLLSRHDR
jgi:hypothetical protein